ncbi:hypothetical protein ACLOJK_008193 [Asimina triloba]
MSTAEQNADDMLCFSCFPFSSLVDFCFLAEFSVEFRMSKKQSIYMCDEILADILCRLPWKTLCRFKCVSKRWRNLISDRKMVIPRRSHTGLVLQCSKYGYNPFLTTTFLGLDNRGGAAASSISLHRTTLSAIQRAEPGIVDSYKGFFLFREDCTLPIWDENNRYFVCNPTTSHLTLEVFDMGPLLSTRIGLVVDDDGKHFKVISASAYHSYIQFRVFSSEERKYRVLKPLGSSPGYALLPIRQPFPKPVKSLFFKGAIHWPLPEHILVYHLRCMFGKLIPLPFFNSPASIKEGEQFIWEFEGCLHYSQVSGGSRIEIWVLLMEEQNYVACDKQSFEWQQKHDVILLHPNSVPDHLRQLSPFAFNGDFQILYLWCHAIIVSYNLVTGKQEEAYACGLEGEQLACADPFVKFDVIDGAKSRIDYQP